MIRTIIKEVQMLGDLILEGGTTAVACLHEKRDFYYNGKKNKSITILF